MTDGFKTHVLTIERLSVTQNATGGQARTYSTANRGSLPTSAKARAVLLNQKEKIEHGVRGEMTGWKFLIPPLNGGSPQITIEDRIRFDYVDGQSHTVRVLSGSHARSTKARFYRVIGEEVTQEP